MPDYIVMRNKPQDGPGKDCAYPFHAFFVENHEQLTQRLGTDILEGDQIYSIIQRQDVQRIEPPLRLVPIVPQKK